MMRGHRLITSGPNWNDLVKNARPERHRKRGFESLRLHLTDNPIDWRLVSARLARLVRGLEGVNEPPKEQSQANRQA